jgi:hypothetical protein
MISVKTLLTKVIPDFAWPFKVGGHRPEFSPRTTIGIPGDIPISVSIPAAILLAF